MWDWAHFKEKGWLAHTREAGKLAGLLLLSGFAMLVHIVLPFWQQPEWLQAKCVGAAICKCVCCEDCECCKQGKRRGNVGEEDCPTSIYSGNLYSH